MGRLLDAAIDFLEEGQWIYEVRPGPDGQRLHFTFNGEAAVLSCWVVSYEDTERLSVVTIYPLVVPEAKRLAVCEYLMRANFGILIGNFELDFQDGEVRFKTSADVESIALTPIFVRNLLYANLGTSDRYFPGLMKVLYANMTPADALAVIRESH